jgi:hypothetical protein
MKGQTTLEFIGAFLFFIIVLTSVLLTTLSDIPQFNDYAEITEKNLEIKKTTDLILTSKGYYDNGTQKGTDWQNHLNDTKMPGLASDEMHIDSAKLDVIRTIEPGYYNYTDMVNDLNLEYEYNFNFTWYPIVETHRTFVRGSPPSSPDIDEPASDYYDNAQNRIHYGSITLEGDTRRFLVTAYDGVYNTTYMSDDWDFIGRPVKGVGDDIVIAGREFTIENIQNRNNRPGASIIISSHLKEFGRNPESADGSRVKVNRYPIYDNPGSSDQLVKMEVLAW